MQQELEFGIGSLNGQSTQGFTFSNSNPSVFNPTISTPSNSFLAQVIDQHTAQNYFANSNDQLARLNDTEILANLDAAVAANQEAISTNNTRIAALKGVTDAYSKQAEAQSALAAANQTAAKSQIAADNAQTVSNMLAALPENPTSQQIAMVNQAIDENPEVFGDQAAAIKSNLSANPPNLDAARSSASSVASSAATTAAADQRAATQAKTNTDNATIAVDSAKKAAVSAGVPESDVTSASAASSATSRLQTENAALTADNANAANAKKYIEDRRTAANEAAKAKDGEVRSERDRRYNIGTLTPNTSTAELYDLRNINYTNFRGSKGSATESKTVGADGKETTTATYRSGASKSYYMHIDYVFSNDLNMSSIDEKYKQNIQPIILNEFQPNEMIMLDDIINGTLKFMGPLLQHGLGIIGDFAKPVTKVVTNVLINDFSKNPSKLYKQRRQSNASTKDKGMDFLFDPVTKVRNMFRGGKWLNTYELPFFNNNFLEANWSKNWDGRGINGDFGDGIGKVIQDKFGIDYPTRPKFAVNMGQAGRSEFDIEFYLINKDVETLKKNFKFLTAFYAGTSWMNLYGGFVRPPNVYNIICPGRFEIPWAAVDSTVTFEGKLRKMSKSELGNEFSGIGSIESQMYWPDAWKMKIHVKDLSVNNFNMYADYYQYGFSPSSYIINEQSVLEDMFDAATWGSEEMAVATEKAKRSMKGGNPILTPAEEEDIRRRAREKVDHARETARTINSTVNTSIEKGQNPLSATLGAASTSVNSSEKVILTQDGTYVANTSRLSSRQKVTITTDMAKDSAGFKHTIVGAEYDLVLAARTENERRLKELMGMTTPVTETRQREIAALEARIAEQDAQLARFDNMSSTEVVEYAQRNHLIGANSNFTIYGGKSNITGTQESHTFWSDPSGNLHRQSYTDAGNTSYSERAADGGTILYGQDVMELRDIVYDRDANVISDTSSTSKTLAKETGRHTYAERREREEEQWRTDPNNPVNMARGLYQDF